MDLAEIDRMIAERKQRVEKRKEDGTLFETEIAPTKKDEDARLTKEVKQQKKKMEDQLKARLPPCPQCGKKMTYLPEEGLVACQDCGIGMRV